MVLARELQLNTGLSSAQAGYRPLTTTGPLVLGWFGLVFLQEKIVLSFQIVKHHQRKVSLQTVIKHPKA